TAQSLPPPFFPLRSEHPARRPLSHTARGSTFQCSNLCELPRLQKRPESLNPEEKWLYILKNIHNFAEKPQGIDESFDRVFELSRLSGLQEKEKFQYFRDMLSDFQKKNIGTAYYNDGLKAGMEKGMERARCRQR
ncbi:MAG: hypothetical protein J6Y32_06650, partial [Bacteroidales bacterium]|nr:hypothetical protein [Bacteroidales bacterium]